MRRRTWTTIALGIAIATPAALSGQVGRNAGVLNPNLATEEQLRAVPQLAADAIRAILDGRPFLGLTPLHDVLKASHPDERLNAVYARLFLPINLNTASREEILLVPGVGARMAHEFEEYRPYRTMHQFRREIGKYVNEREVARLARYVEIR